MRMTYSALIEIRTCFVRNNASLTSSCVTYVSCVDHALRLVMSAFHPCACPEIYVMIFPLYMKSDFPLNSYVEKAAASCRWDICAGYKRARTIFGAMNFK